MKETSGELNLTLITVVFVAMLVAFFYFAVWPAIKTTLNSYTRCNEAICENNPNAEGMVTCKYMQKSGVEIDLMCVYKG